MWSRYQPIPPVLPDSNQPATTEPLLLTRAGRDNSTPERRSICLCLCVAFVPKAAARMADKPVGTNTRSRRTGSGLWAAFGAFPLNRPSSSHPCSRYASVLLSDLHLRPGSSRFSLPDPKSAPLDVS